MRSASVRVVQHKLAEVLSWVEAGEEVEITRRDKVVARLVPARRNGMPQIDFMGRLRSVFSEPLPDELSVSRLVIEERDER